MHILRTVGGLAFGLAIALAAMLDVEPRAYPAAAAAQSALQLSLAVEAPSGLLRRSSVAEVSVAFDGQGRVAASQLRRSSGSRASDAAAIGAARELAGLHSPADVAGRTLLIRVAYRA